jgi:hypothetical protein
LEVLKRWMDLQRSVNVLYDSSRCLCKQFILFLLVWTVHLALHSACIKEQVKHAFGFPNDHPIQVSSIISDAVLLCVRATHYWNFKLFSIVQFTLYDLLKRCPVTSWRDLINICSPCSCYFR